MVIAAVSRMGTWLCFGGCNHLDPEVLCECMLLVLHNSCTCFLHACTSTGASPVEGIYHYFLLFPFLLRLLELVNWNCWKSSLELKLLTNVKYSNLGTRNRFGLGNANAAATVASDASRRGQPAKTGPEALGRVSALTTCQYSGYEAGTFLLVFPRPRDRDEPVIFSFTN